MAYVEGGVRRLVLDYGREKARAMVRPELRNLVDIAAEVLGADDQGIGITYTGFCLTALPHKRLPNHQVWEKIGHRVRLIVRSRLNSSQILANLIF